MQRTNHAGDKTSRPQPLGVVLTNHTARKDGECEEFKDDGKCHQSLTSNEPCCKAHQDTQSIAVDRTKYYKDSLYMYCMWTQQIFTFHNHMVYILAAWHSGRTWVFDRRTFPVLRSTYSWRVTTYVGKPSAVGQPTRPTQPFILFGSIDE